MTPNPVQIDVTDPVYLPFTPTELSRHFVEDKEAQLDYYLKSASRYHMFRDSHPELDGTPISESRLPCQIEKDERFWTAAALKQLVDHPSRIESLANLLSDALGPHPPLHGFQNWKECLSGQLELVLEAVLPSPASYGSWLQNNVEARNFIPYVLRAAARSSARTLEGATHVDAMIINVDNGFSILIEAKVLSDISGGVSFDVLRNQIVRNLDVMLELNDAAKYPLNKRQADRSLFVLLTPEHFIKHPHSRFYGWLLNEYRSNPRAIGRDLPHRKEIDWTLLSRKIGWVTFEGIRSAIPGACPWLRP